MGRLSPPDEACDWDVSTKDRSCVAAGKRVWMRVSKRVFVGEFCGVGRRTGERHVGQTGCAA